MADDANRFVVGAIGVKARPDTEEFPRELRKQLRKIKKQIRPLLVDVDPDTKGLLREVNRAVSAVEKAVDDVDVDVSLDQRQLVRDVAKAKKRLDSIKDKRVKVKTLVDENGLRQLQRQVQAWDKFNEATREHADAADQMAEAQRNLQREVKALDDFVNRKVNWTEALLNPTEGARGRDALDKRIAAATEEMFRLQEQVEGTERALGELYKSSDVKLALKMDEKSLAYARQQIEDFKDYLDPKRTIEMRVEPDLKSIKEAQRRIDRMLGEDGGFNFKVSADPEELRKLRQHLEDLKDDYNNTELDFEPVLDGVNSRLVSLRLAYLARDRWVKFAPVVDSKAAKAVASSLAALSGLRMLGSTFENLWDWVKNLDKNIPLIASVTLAVMGLSGALLSATSNTLAFARSLAQIAGAGLALPGIMAGFAVGIGSTVAVLRDFNQALPGVQRGLSALQDQMSSRFWREAARPMQRAFDSLMRPFSEGVRETSSALGLWFSEMARSAERNVGRSMPAMFERLNDSIRIASRSADDFMRIVELLGQYGSEYLPRLAQWGNRVTKSFRGWLDEADRTGRLAHYIELGVDQLHHLGRALRHTGGIFTDLAIAAEKAGGSSLKAVADQLGDIRAVTSSPKFQAGLVRTFESAHDAMSRIADESGPRVSWFFENLSHIFERGMPDVGEAVGHLLGGMAEALATERFTEGFLNMLQGIREGVQSLDGMWGPVGDGLGALGELVGDLARYFGPLLSEALKLAASAAQRLAPHLSRIAETLSGRLLSILERFGPLVIDVAEAFLRLVEPLLRVPGLLEAVVLAFGAWKLAAWVGGMKKVVTALTDMWKGLRKLPGAFRSTGYAAVTFSDKVGKAVGAAGLAMAALPVGKAIADSITGLELAAPEVELLASRFTQLGDGMSGFDAILADLDLPRFQNFSDAVHDLANLSGFDKFLHDMGMSASRSEEAAEAFDNAGAALTQMAQNDLKAAQEAFAFLAMEAGGTDQAAHNLLKLMPSFRSEMLRVAVASGLATDEQTILKLAIGSMSDAATVGADETAELNAELLGMPEGAKVATSHMEHYREAMRRVNGVTPELLGGIEATARSFIDLSEGLDAENFSLDGWLDQLEQQVRDMQAWADNMAVIARQGNEDVVMALNDLGPAGATAVAELADGIRKNDGEATDAFNRLAEVLAAGADGAVGAAGGEFAQLSAELTGHLAAAELATVIGMDQIELAAALGGDGTVNALQQSIINGVPGVAANMDRLIGALEGDPVHAAWLGSEQGQALVNALILALHSGAPPAKNGGDALANASADGLATGAALWSVEGENAVGQYVRAIDTQQEAAKSSAVAVAGAAVTGLSTGDWVQIGREKVTTFLNGLLGSTGSAKNGGDAVANAAREGARGNVSWSGVGSLGATSFTTGVLNGKARAKSAGGDLANHVDSGMSVLPGLATGKGKDGGRGFSDGLSGQQRAAGQAAKSLVNMMTTSWMRVSQVAAISGKAAGSGFAEGLAGRTGQALSAGRALANAAGVGGRLGYGRLFSAGSFAGAGFAAGVRARYGSAYSAGVSLGRAASAGARSALQVRSPSRVMMQVGHFAGEGLVVGLQDMQAKVEDAGERLADAAARGAGGRSLRVESDLAVSEAMDGAGRYHGATVYLTVNNPVERSSSQELNAGLQTLDVLV